MAEPAYDVQRWGDKFQVTCSCGWESEWDTSVWVGEKWEEHAQDLHGFRAVVRYRWGRGCGV